MWIIAIAPAYAGCDKDTDCKGDRVCEDGTCVDGARPAKKKRDDQRLDEAASLRGGAMGLEIAAWSLGGAGLLFGVTGSALGLAQAGIGVSTGVGGVGLVSIVVAGPLAGAAGGRARRGVELLGGPERGNGARITGWILYGAGLATGVGAIGVGLGGDSAGGAIGMGACALAGTGTFLLAGDASGARRQLSGAIDDERAAAPTFTPFVVADGEHLGLGVGGTF